MALLFRVAHSAFIVNIILGAKSPITQSNGEFVTPARFSAILNPDFNGARWALSRVSTANAKPSVCSRCSAMAANWRKTANSSNEFGWGISSGDLQRIWSAQATTSRTPASDTSWTASQIRAEAHKSLLACERYLYACVNTYIYIHVYIICVYLLRRRDRQRLFWLLAL